MLLKFLLSILIFLVIYSLLKLSRKNIILSLTKFSLQIGILVLFIGGFIKLFLILPSNAYVKIMFFMIYMWCTVGMNVNFMIPLINLIDEKIEKDI